MDEALVRAVTDEVCRRLGRPRALLLGRAPAQDCGWEFVREGAHEAVVLGSVSAAELLRFPDEVSCEALLLGKPVYLCREGLDYRAHGATASRALWTQLLAAERRLRALGVKDFGQTHGGIVTAQQVRRLLAEGQPVRGRLTPLAQDILEGKA